MRLPRGGLPLDSRVPPASSVIRRALSLSCFAFHCVARLVSRAKPAIVYIATTKTFATLKTPADLVGLLSSAATDVRIRVEEYIHDHVTEFAQPRMF